MKLIASHPEDTLQAVRALSEGRGPRRVLRTVPFVPFTAPVARAKAAYEDRLVLPLPTERKGAPRGAASPINGLMDQFRASRPGRFTARICAQFLLTAGWAADTNEAERNVATKLRSLCRAGQVVEIGKSGRQILWRFK